MREFVDAVHPWTRRHTTDEIIELATLLRIPVAPIGTGETVTGFEHFRERGTFVSHPDGDFVQPRIPYRVGDRPRPAFRPAPTLGEHTGQVQWDGRRAGAQPDGSHDPLPLEGVKVLDFTAFWAGPAATHMLAALGAQMKAMRARRIVFDAIDVVLELLPDQASKRREIYRLHEWLRRRKLQCGSRRGQSAGRPLRVRQADSAEAAARRRARH